MMVIACSAPDAASMNIFRWLVEGREWQELQIGNERDEGIERLFIRKGTEHGSRGTGDDDTSNTGATGAAPSVCLAVIPELHLYADFVERRIIRALSGKVPGPVSTVDIECLIFPSKHRAESGKRSFTIHPVGNYGPEALYGGRPRTLSPAAPFHMSEALRILKRLHSSPEETGIEDEGICEILSGFEVSFEVSHHGPLLDVPSFFIEIGSSEKEWEIPGAGKLLAAVITELIEKGVPQEREQENEIIVGLGGGHYAPRFSDAATTDGIDFGHIAPGYALKNLDGDLAREMVEKSTGRPAGGAAHRDEGTGIGDVKLRVYAHGKKNRKYYRHFNGFDADIIEL